MDEFPLVTREGRIMSFLAAGALALALTACSPPPPDTSLVISSDPELRNRVAELLPVLAERAQMELTHPIRAERRSREALERYLRFKLDQELPPEEAEVRTLSYALLGMMDEGVDLREILLAVYTEQVAGFYDPDSTALFVLDDMPMEMLEPVLIHELVHAVQDQTANLDSLTAKGRGNDRQVAAQSAIEGHATLIMLEFMAEEVQGQRMDLSTLPDFSESIRPALEAMGQQYPALTSAPAIIQESLLAPYIEGATYMAAFWQGVEGRPAPFGSFLPQSTEQILHPNLAPGREEDPPTELRVSLENGGVVRYQNTLGQMEVGIFLDALLGEGHRELAQGWDGDRFLLLEGAEGASLVWASVWDTQTQRDAFVAGLQGALGGLPLPSTLHGEELMGRPGAILRVGLSSEASVTVREGDTR
jgi:hypothetical protein